MKRFTKEFLNNKLFLEQAISFDQMGTVSVNGESVKTGVFYQETGDVLVRLYLPEAKKVCMNVSVSNKVFADVDFENKGDGIFEGTIYFDERMTGPANVKTYVNDVSVVVPDLPVIWTDNRPQNNIEIPDEEGDYLLVKDVPHGSLIRETFWSNSTGDWEHCMIYTPPGYMKNDEKYPVLYLLHGGGDNELMWEYVGKMSHILDNLWADGKAEKFIVVMLNGMLREGGRVGMGVDKV